MVGIKVHQGGAYNGIATHGDTVGGTQMLLEKFSIIFPKIEEKLQFFSKILEFSESFQILTGFLQFLQRFF